MNQTLNGSVTLMKVCKKIVFTGHVQGVGFRFTTKRIAAVFEVAGYVKNLPDGSVELMAEGDADEVDAFVDAVKQQMAAYITDSKLADHSVENFADFRIRT